MTSPTSKSSDPFGNPNPWAEPSWYNSLHSPYYSTSHRRLRSYVRDYINTRVLPYAPEWEASGEVPQSERIKYAASGLAFADVPAEYRPKGFEKIGDTDVKVEELDAFHTLLMADETSRVEGGVMVGLEGASVIGAPPIINHGTSAQKARFLPSLFTTDTSLCLGITEPTAGSDVAAIATTATLSPDKSHYSVSGRKKWITGSPWASHMTTAVRTGGAGAAGISLLIIPLRNTPGVTVERIANSGQKAGGASYVTLDNVKVPAENLIGETNRGFPLIMTNFNKERYILAVACNRKARTALTAALEYAHERETFGKPLAAHQIIRHKLVDIARDVEAHFAWLEAIAYHVHMSPAGWQGADVAARTAMVKVSGGRLLERAVREAQQVLGGNGYSVGGVGGEVEQMSRDLRMMVVGGGSEEILGDLAWREEGKAARLRGARL